MRTAALQALRFALSLELRSENSLRSILSLRPEWVSTICPKIKQNSAKPPVQQNYVTPMNIAFLLAENYS